MEGSPVDTEEQPVSSEDTSEDQFIEGLRRRLLETLTQSLDPTDKDTWSLPPETTRTAAGDEPPAMSNEDAPDLINDDGEDEDEPLEPPTEPIPIPLYQDNSHRDLKPASINLLREIIEGYTIGFDLAAFPDAITNWIFDLREHALPGSYAHLLLLMFDEVDAFNHLQMSMASPGMPDFLNTHRQRVLDTDELRNYGWSSEWGPAPRKSATLVAGSTKNSRERAVDELCLSNELRMLRSLVAPLRDLRQPVFWITSREEQAEEMIKQFETSQELIDDFKDRLKWRHGRHGNWTFYSPPTNTGDSPSRDRWQRRMSLHQYRLDACEASTMWKRFPPDETEHTGWCPEPPDDIPFPPVQITKNYGAEFDDNPDLTMDYEGQIVALLVQVAQWLALARGYAAVHLFTDTVRLFTMVGVDVANATQVEVCKYLIAEQLWPDGVGNSSSVLRESERARCGSTLIQGVMETSRALGQRLIEVDTLLHRDDESISWDIPLQLLKWVRWGDQRSLALDTPFGGGRVTLWHCEREGEEDAPAGRPAAYSSPVFTRQELADCLDHLPGFK